MTAEPPRSLYDIAIDSEFKRLVDQGVIKDETVYMMKLAGLFGTIGFIFLFSYICCCVCACTFSPEMCSVVYSPMCNCAVRSFCWPFLVCRYAIRRMRRIKAQ